MPEQPMTFTKWDDGRVTVNRWDAETEISDGLLAVADPALILVRGDTILIRAANGWAQYRIVGREEYRHTTRLRLMDSELVQDKEATNAR